MSNKSEFEYISMIRSSAKFSTELIGTLTSLPNQSDPTSQSF